MDSQSLLAYNKNNLIDWRHKEKRKTVAVGIALCLNIGVDPPDIVKPQECSLLEGWIDPFSFTHPSRAIEQIGKNVLSQYEVWQPRARYKLMLDASVDEVKKFGLSNRKTIRANSLNTSAIQSKDKEERLIFHYNGHGVPRPTNNGELWVFNKNFTQYIPVSVIDLIEWIGPNTLYVIDCSSSGNLVKSFETFIMKDKKRSTISGKNTKTQVQNLPVVDVEEELNTISTKNYDNCYFITACGVNEILPVDPELPADLLTSCLTTPIQIALLWHMKNKHYNINIKNEFTLEMIYKIPGKITDRRSFLGEMNWIYTAITDTIAWDCIMNSDKRNLRDKTKSEYSTNNMKFQKLYRQDLLLASMFRNYLLALRVFDSYGCRPMSVPNLPANFIINHPLWESWDHIVDHFVSQLPEIIENSSKKDNQLQSNSFQSFENMGSTQYEVSGYDPSCFFSHHLKSFETYLKHQTPLMQEKSSQIFLCPVQLPIVLQVLLSQNHRTTALRLLCEFINIGISSINACLSVGIFPYILKLLQSPALELKPYLIFIWFKLISVDISCQNDLAKDASFVYFINIIQDNNQLKEIYNSINASSNNSSYSRQMYYYKNLDYRAMSMFIITMFCSNKFKIGKISCLKNNLLNVCYKLLDSSLPENEKTNGTFCSKDKTNFTLGKDRGFHPSLVKWTCLGIYQMINGSLSSEPEIDLFLEEENIRVFLSLLFKVLQCDLPELRVAAMFPISVIFDIKFRVLDEAKISLLHHVILELTSTIRRNNYTDAFGSLKLCYIEVVGKFVNVFSLEFMCVAYDILKEKQNKILCNFLGNNYKNNRSSHPLGPQNFHDRLSFCEFIEDVNRLKSFRQNYFLYLLIWKFTLNLSVDKKDLVSKHATKIIDSVNQTLLKNICEGFENTKTFLNIAFISSKFRNENKNNLLQSSDIYNGNARSSLQSDSAYNLENIKNRLKKSASLTIKSLIPHGENFEAIEKTDLNTKKAISNIIESNTINLFKPKTRLKIPNLSINSENDGLYEEMFECFVSECTMTNFPKLKQKDKKEPGSKQYIKNLNKKKRLDQQQKHNSKIIISFEQDMKGIICINLVLENKTSRWSSRTFQLNNSSVPKDFEFHLENDICLIVDYNNCISIWDYEKNKKIAKPKTNSTPRNVTCAINWLKNKTSSDNPRFLQAFCNGDLALYEVELEGKKFDKFNEIEIWKSLVICDKKTTWSSKSDTSHEKLISKQTKIQLDNEKNSENIIVSSSIGGFINLWDYGSLKLTQVNFPSFRIFLLEQIAK